MKKHFAFLLYSRNGKPLNCFEEEKYKDLAHALEARGLAITTLTWTGSNLPQLEEQAQTLDGFLIWVNPVDRGLGDGSLEALMTQWHVDGKYV